MTTEPHPRAAATLIALLAEGERRPGDEEATLLRVLALVYGFLHQQAAQQGPGVLLDPDRWLDALTHLPFITPAETTSDSAQGRRGSAGLAPEVERALLDRRAQVGALPSLPRFLQKAAPFVAAPPAPGTRQAVTVVTARTSPRAGAGATLAVTSLQLAAGRGTGPVPPQEYQLATRRNVLTLDTSALVDAQNRADFDSLTEDADVRALVRLSTFVSLTVGPP